MKISCLALLLGILCGSLAHAADRPNFVFILIDDLAHDTLGYTGRIEGLKTPHIDRLATEGARFDKPLTSANGTWAGKVILAPDLIIVRRVVGPRKVIPNKDLTSIFQPENAV